MAKYFAELGALHYTVTASRGMAYRKGSVGLTKGKTNLKLYDNYLCFK